MKGKPIAPHLAADIAKGVLGALFVSLVDRHQVCKVEHPDLFQLGGGPVFGGHNVQGQVGKVHYRGVGLSDAGGFQNGQVESGRPEHR